MSTVADRSSLETGQGTQARWELGSEFHWFPYRPAASEETPWEPNSELFVCARDALRALILDGMASRGWRRLWVPGYFCQEVVKSFVSTGIQIALYGDDPQELAPRVPRGEMRSGDVVFIVNFFGLRSECPSGLSDLGTVETIEDHSHDPWSDWARSSSAAWCVSSLRKVLPVPDGGVLWSPQGRSLPSAPGITAQRRDAASLKLAAMILKSMYLNGHDVDKSVFRELAVAGENSLAGDGPAAVSEYTRSIVRTFPSALWRNMRLRNHRVLSESLSGLPWLTVLQPHDTSKSCPFSGMLLFDSAGRREHVRQNLIHSSVYPAVLWPLHEPAVPDIDDHHHDLSLRMISIPCDMRYGESDMACVAELISRSGAQYCS